MDSTRRFAQLGVLAASTVLVCSIAILITGREGSRPVEGISAKFTTIASAKQLAPIKVQVVSSSLTVNR